MSIFIATAGLFLSVEQRAALERKFRGALERFGPRLKSLHLYFADANGHRRGVDKTCRIVLHVRRQPCVVIEDQDAQWAALIERAANRLAHATSRQLAFRRSPRRPMRMAG